MFTASACPTRNDAPSWPRTSSGYRPKPGGPARPHGCQADVKKHSPAARQGSPVAGTAAGQLPPHPGTALPAGVLGAASRQPDGGKRRERESVAVPRVADGRRDERGGDDVSGRTVRRFVEGLLRGRSTEPARPDDLEAQEMKTAIELRAARLGSDSPREESVTDLHRRLADAMDETNTPKPLPGGLRPAPVGRSSSAQASPLRQRPPESWSVARCWPGTPSRQPLRPPTGSWSPTAVPGGRSAQASTCLTAERSRSTSVRSADSSTGPIPGSRRSPVCAPIKAASCGWTRPSNGCAARAIRRRQRGARLGLHRAPAQSTSGSRRCMMLRENGCRRSWRV